MAGDSLKRLVVLVVSGAVLLIAPKLGFDISPEAALAFAGLVAGYLVQSGMKSAAVVKADAGLVTLESVLERLLAAQKDAALEAGKAAGANAPSSGGPASQ